jgi:hypothetical protein
MKTITAVLSLLMLSSVAAAQNPDPSKWMCRNLADSGGFLYQGETPFGTQACRPIPHPPLAAPVAAPAPREDTGTTAPVAAAPNAAAPAVATTLPPPDPTTPPTKVNDGKTRLYITDEPKDESIFLAAHRSGWQVNGQSSGQVSGSFVNGTGTIRGSSNGYLNGSGGSAGAAYGYSQKGGDPRTVEIQADIYKKCPAIIVTSDPSRGDYVLLFRREGGKRSSMFIFGGLTGLALSAHAKVDGASVFDTNGDMVFATRARTVSEAIKEVCVHLK